ncbi:MAG: Teichoic acids export ATP-binding protein TagH [Parcubacteria group bacterium ADurb.Bin316]|nr:MAG: Teichoic acids export ATP-binding protein TagH [Parcubacteria group bacterium ADurb.Bin316]
MPPIIEIKNLGKKYNITHQQGGYIALRDVITNVFKNPFRFAKSKAKQIAGLEKKEIFWALNDINLTVESGEVVGIIGRNGAGKSTLLKILSQITPPTTGEVIINGTLGSLLEVGTGFHPELSGRENIMLNGAILGMSKKEIIKKFDAIVEFAGIAKFLDTPVKYYSSGMYVRLAFSVAAHLEPDILLVDEVLAVGDAEFQKKCLGKMGEITKKEGRTILFVSHNMEAIQRLCEKCILLENGIIATTGITEDVVKTYTSSFNNQELGEWINKGDEFKNDYFKPEKFFITKDEKNNLFVNIEAEVKKIVSGLTVGYAIYSEDNILLYWSYQTDTSEDEWPIIKNGKCFLKSKIPAEILNNGIFRIQLLGGLHHKEWLFPPNKFYPMLTINLSRNFSKSPYWTEKRPGLLAPKIKWTN